MKTKSEAKRLAILKAAAEVFREVGFERASMSEICARVGGSKATLYNYFPSKERLFFEVMYQAKATELEVVAGSLNPDANDLKAEFLHLGCEFLRFFHTREAVEVRRLAIAGSGTSEIGRMLFERAVAPTEEHVAEFVKKVMKRGILRTSDPKRSAVHLLSLLESEHAQHILHGATPAPASRAINSSVRRAVDAYLSGYENRT